MMLKKLLMASNLLAFSFSGAFAQNQADNRNPDAALKGVHFIEEENANKEKLVCVYVNRPPDKPLKNCFKQKRSGVSAKSSPHRCPTTPSSCVETSGGVAYVYCTHTGGGPIHMDMYSGSTSGAYLGRVEDVGSKPPACPNFLPPAHKQKHPAKHQDRPVTCTGTCNFNYYSKP